MTRHQTHNLPRRRKAANLVVRRTGRTAHAAILRLGPLAFAAAIGRSGTTAFKREGDGATPISRMAITGLMIRPRARFCGPAAMPWRPIRDNDGWCEVPASPAYNRLVRLPFPASHERLLRPDGLYDAVFVLDWNLTHRARHRGSAIFLHLAREGFGPTAGCVAVDRHAMAILLRHIRPKSRLTVLP